MSETTVIIDEVKLLSSLGICMRAGAVIAGVPLICTALKKGGAVAPKLVIEASDTSDNTHKRISDRCAYYGVRRVRLESDGTALAAAIGKSSSVAAVAVTDESLCRLAEKYIRFEQ